MFVDKYSNTKCTARERGLWHVDRCDVHLARLTPVEISRQQSRKVLRGISRLRDSRIRFLMK